jgi:hypothetical protein
MAELLSTEVTTSESDGEQLLRVEANVDGEGKESLFYLRPLGTNTWFTLRGTGRAGASNGVDPSSSEALHEIEEALVEQGFPIRPLNNSSNYPETGTVEVQFSGETIHRYPLFSDTASIVISEVSNISSSNTDATVTIEYSDKKYEYAIHVSDGTLPDDWILADIAIWADAVELGDTLHSHDDLRNPDRVSVR